MNILKTTFLLTGLTLLLLFVGKAIGGNGGMMMALIMAGVMNLVSYWFSDKIVLKMYGAREVTEAEAPRLYRITNQLAMKAMLPMPKVYIIPGMSPNAFATGRNPQHAAVAAIEGAISYLAHMAQWAAIFGGGRDRDEEGGSPFVMIAMAIVAPIAAMLIQMAISRSREYSADAYGARICRKPLALASALKKLHMGVAAIPMNANSATAHMFIVSPLTGGGLMSLFSTHPPMEERVKRLEELSRQIF